MINKTLLIHTLVFLLSFSPETSAQKFLIGEYAGINFSNIHGDLKSSKWVSENGLGAGFLIEYQLNKSFHLQSELSLISNNYRVKTYDGQYTGYYNGDFYGSDRNRWNYSFLRLPLLIKYRTPTKLQFGIGAGVFYSFLQNDEYSKEERAYLEDTYGKVYPPTNDWGYMVSTDLSYPITNNLKIFVDGRISAGQKVFIQNYEAKNGASEIVLGFKITPSLGRNNTLNENDNSLSSDELLSNVYLKPAIGMSYTWNATNQNIGNYSGYYSSHTGITVGYRLDERISIESGLQLFKRGYGFDDSSIYTYRYAKSSTHQVSDMDTKVILNYLTIPLNFKIVFDESFPLYANLGVYAGFMLNASSRGAMIQTFSSNNSYTVQEVILNDAVAGYFKSVDLGPLVGLGFQYPVKNSFKLDLGVNYSRSFQNLLVDSEMNSDNIDVEDSSIKNGAFSLQLGIQIPIYN